MIATITIVEYDYRAMRFTIAPQQRTYFQKNHLITFENLIDPKKIACFQEKIRPTNNKLLSLIKKDQLAEIAFELMGKAPLRLARIEIGQKIEIQEDECALALSYEDGSGDYCMLPLYKGEQSCYLILVFTSRYLHEESHPTVFRNY